MKNMLNTILIRDQTDKFRRGSGSCSDSNHYQSAIRSVVPSVLVVFNQNGSSSYQNRFQILQGPSQNRQITEMINLIYGRLSTTSDRLLIEIIRMCRAFALPWFGFMLMLMFVCNDNHVQKLDVTG